MPDPRDQSISELQGRLEKGLALLREAEEQGRASGPEYDRRKALFDRILNAYECKSWDAMQAPEQGALSGVFGGGQT